MSLQDTQQLAASLINTKTLPPGLGRLTEQAQEARAYDTLQPYPLYHFRDWKTEDRGPLPRCMPFAKSIVRRGAKWLFGKPLELTSSGNPALEKLVKDAWTQNNMGSRLVAMAKKAALESGIVLKFAYDPKAKPSLIISSLSLIDEVRLYYHPHNREQLLMARVQYAYYDAVQDKTFWYREEWTDEREVHYYPVPDADLKNKRQSADVYEGWIIDEDASKDNPFGLIPLVHIKNLETDDLWGEGDLWDLYRVIDRIHLTYHLMDKSNQFDVEQNPIFIDLDVDEDDIDRPMEPGQPLAVESKNDASNGHQGKVEFPRGGNSLRPAMMEYAKDLRQQVLSAASSVEVDQADFTNKGNLTVAVLQQLYLPQIEVTDEKRKTWGAGLCDFFARIGKGLQKIGMQLGVVDTNEKSFAVQIAWAAYFEPSEDEKAAKLGRIQDEEAAGYTTHERALKTVAQMEGVDDIEVLQEELKDWQPPDPTLGTGGAAPAGGADALNKQIATLKALGGKDAP